MLFQNDDDDKKLPDWQENEAMKEGAERYLEGKDADPLFDLSSEEEAEKRREGYEIAREEDIKEKVRDKKDEDD